MAGLLIGNNNFSTGTLGSGVTFPAGHIIKTYSKTYTDSHAFGTSFSWTTVGLSDSNNLVIDMDTPKSSSSKYFIQCALWVSEHGSETLEFRILDIGSSHIIRADSAGSRNNSFMGIGHQSTGNGSVYHLANAVGSYLWSPGSASAERVTLQATCSGGTTFYVNRSSSDNDATWQSRSVSTMTVTEVAG